MNPLPLFIVCHLCGDFLFQNHWMQRKSENSFVCAVHVMTYMLPFLLAGFLIPAPAWMLCAIAVEHFLQDRYALHLKWMRFYSHSTSDQWPTGPLCIDQSMHITFIGIICLFLK